MITEKIYNNSSLENKQVLNLYKYVKPKYAIEILNNDFIKISNSTEMNDPFEGDILYPPRTIFNFYTDDFINYMFNKSAVPFNAKEIAQIKESIDPFNELLHIVYINANINEESFDEFKNDFLKEFLKEQNTKILKLNNNLKNQIYFTCLSRCNNIIPMWAHYSDNHKGICIGYDFNNDDDWEFLTDVLSPIEYTNSKDSKEYLDDLLSMDLDIFKKYDSPLNLLSIPFLKKSKDWSYEKEWRLIFDKNSLEFIKNSDNLSYLVKKEFNVNNQLYYPLSCDKQEHWFVKFPKPKSVYLGLNISDSLKNKIINICLERKISVFQMEKNVSKYDLDSKKLF